MREMTFADLDVRVPPRSTPPPVTPAEFAVVAGFMGVVPAVGLVYPVRVVGPPAIGVDSGPAGVKIGSEVLSVI